MVCTALWFMVQDEVVPYSCYWFLFKDNPHLNNVETDFCCLAGKPGAGYECGFWLSPLSHRSGSLKWLLFFISYLFLLEKRLR